MKENFFKVEDFGKTEIFKKVNEFGEVVILENNKPKYILKPLLCEEKINLTEDELVEVVAKRILNKHKKAFEDLGQ